MRFSSTMIDSHNAVVAGASALPAAVAQFHRWAEQGVITLMRTVMPAIIGVIAGNLLLLDASADTAGVTGIKPNVT